MSRFPPTIRPSLLAPVAKSIIARKIGRILRRRYLRNTGPVARIVGISSEQVKNLIDHKKHIVPPVPIRRVTPKFYLKRELEEEYVQKLMAGSNFTKAAGIISAKDVDVSLSSGLHQIGRHILREAIPADWIFSQPRYYYAAEMLRLKGKQVMEEAILLSMPWHHNFYHWIIEILPRLISIDRSPELQQLPLIVPRKAPAFVAESLTLSNYVHRVRFLDDGAYRFKRLHLLSVLTETTEVSPDAIDWLCARFSKQTDQSSATRRIYVSRSDALTRYVSNEESLRSVLSDFGFTIMTMTGLSLAQQIALFQSAECVIGPHGAAFANLAFIRRNAIFIEFFPQDYCVPCFNHIAAIKNLEYGFLVGKPTRRSGYEINPSDLRSLLSQALPAGNGASVE
jgi:hypothetical protein